MPKHMLSHIHWSLQLLNPASRANGAYMAIGRSKNGALRTADVGNSGSSRGTTIGGKDVVYISSINCGKPSTVANDYMLANNQSPHG